MICGANLEAKPFTLQFLYSFYQKPRLNLLLAVPAFQVADERGQWDPGVHCRYLRGTNWKHNLIVWGQLLRGAELL